MNLAIADDGVGLDGSYSDHEGLGMRNMKFRAGVIGANLSIESPPDGGTVVNCHLNREHWILKENGS
jgi:signal transduction histidine kinase